jgi:hypothetical protein
MIEFELKQKKKKATLICSSYPNIIESAYVQINNVRYHVFYERNVIYNDIKIIRIENTEGDLL